MALRIIIVCEACLDGNLLPVFSSWVAPPAGRRVPSDMLQAAALPRQPLATAAVRQRRPLPRRQIGIQFSTVHTELSQKPRSSLWNSLPCAPDALSRREFSGGRDVLFHGWCWPRHWCCCFIAH